MFASGPVARPESKFSHAASLILVSGLSMHSDSSEHEPIFSNAEQITGDPDGEDTILDDESDVHIASQAEKKNFWWRNTLINTFFILAWYNSLTIVFLLELLSVPTQVPLCDGALRV
ncbi:hypothetical protein J3R82DRAFT_10208 [Butyriboletus roseoflavus]|nr:hypothetical protein J3R82DRAFT_10208 [Butyriboletus roseoflavus]